MSDILEFQGKHRYLSNFWPCVIRMDNEPYGSVEHAYQAAKTLDRVARLEFQKSNVKPGDAKRLGRLLIVRPDWEEVKLDVMYHLVTKKFRYPILRDLLLQTGEVKLVEGNNWGDVFWGVSRGRGENHLGKILMRVREEIKNEAISNSTDRS